MLISGTVLSKTIKEVRDEYLNVTNRSKGDKPSMYPRVSLGLSIVYFILELVVMFYSLSFAMSCSTSNPEKVVNMVLAFTFPLPYAMFNLLLNPCFKSSLSGSAFYRRSPGPGPVAQPSV